MSFQRWHAPGCTRPVDHAASCAAATPPVSAVLRDMGCPPLALRLIEATVAAKFSAGRTELHLERDDLRAILGAFAMAYEEARQAQVDVEEENAVQDRADRRPERDLS